LSTKLFVASAGWSGLATLPLAGGFRGPSLEGAANA
jgi:hypothetical protein